MINVAKIIYQTLKEISELEIVSFHMPGHKSGRIFKELGYEKEIANLLNLDTTEVIGTDNLHNPSGIIEESQNNSRKILFPENDNYDLIYLINGSTCGIESAIMASCKPGDKIIINRASHQSAYNACILSNVEPIFVNEMVDSENNIFLGVQREEYIKAIENNKDAKAIFITRPTYYGMSFEIKDIIETAHNHGMFVIVDEAHGAHLGLNDKLPKSSVKYGADFIIQSIHKTLPSFTQSSIMLVRKNSTKKEEKILVCSEIYNRLRSSLNMFESSSPSYVFLMGIEFAVDIYEKFGKTLMEKLLNNIYVFKRKVKNYNIFNTNDPTKIFINTIEKGINGYEFSNILRYRYNIQVELSNYSGVLLLCTIANSKNDFDRMVYALEDINTTNIFGIERSKKHKIINDKIGNLIRGELIHSVKASKKIGLIFPKSIPVRTVTPNYAFNMEKESVSLEKAIGRISGEFVTPYPPGVCVLAPGEVINMEIVNYIKSAIKIGMEINGMANNEYNSIIVLKEKK